ncbi:hypothetical protein OOO38_005111 [Salmonella enterica]|nr:hypothetical protein [Salmonella enterica]EKC2694437.1 hypothetical protein [Salmonella enterica]
MAPISIRLIKMKREKLHLKDESVFCAHTFWGSIVSETYNENIGMDAEEYPAGSKMAVIDREKRDGYQFICTPVITEDGEAYENALNFAQNNGMQQSLCAAVLQIDKIYSLRSDADAGKKIQ